MFINHNHDLLFVIRPVIVISQNNRWHPMTSGKKWLKKYDLKWNEINLVHFTVFNINLYCCNILKTFLSYLMVWETWPNFARSSMKIITYYNLYSICENALLSSRWNIAFIFLKHFAGSRVNVVNRWTVINANTLYWSCSLKYNIALLLFFRRLVEGCIRIKNGSLMWWCGMYDAKDVPMWFQYVLFFYFI